MPRNGLFCRRDRLYNAAMQGVNVRKLDGILVVSFTDRRLTDDEQILRISDELREVLDSAATGTRLLIDFGEVESVASMMLGDLVALNKKAQRKGVMLQLSRPASNVLRVIKTCQLDRLFDIVPEAPPGSAT